MATRLRYAKLKLQNGWQALNMTQIQAEMAPSTTDHHRLPNGQHQPDPDAIAAARALLSPHNLPRNASSPPQWASLSNSSTVPTRPDSVSPPQRGSPVSRALSRQPSVPINGNTLESLADASATQPFPDFVPLDPPQVPRARHQPALGRTSSSRGHSRHLSVADSMMFGSSREQEAVASLMFMRSPGNTDSSLSTRRNTTTAFGLSRPLAPAPALSSSSSSSALLSPLAPANWSAQSTPGRPPAEPNSRERKPLPTHKPTHRTSMSMSMVTPRRIDLDSDESEFCTPRPEPGSRRKLPSSASFETPTQYEHDGYEPGAAPLTPKFTLPSALGSLRVQPRKRLSDEELDVMLDEVMTRRYRGLSDRGPESDPLPIEIPVRQRTKLPS